MLDIPQDDELAVDGEANTNLLDIIAQIDTKFDAIDLKLSQVESLDTLITKLRGEQLFKTQQTKFNQLSKLTEEDIFGKKEI